jgi:SAM-dependent methyltransferase
VSDPRVRRTLGHYDADPQGFWEATRAHDVEQNRRALLEAIEGEGPFDLLDFGCGPGRDVAVFRAMGHRAIGLDGSAAFATMAREFSGAEIWHRDMLDMRLPEGAFDAVFANASLFHVPTSDLPRVLREIHATLRPRGVLFSSNPRGNGDEGFNGDRWGAYHDLDGWRAYLDAAGFDEVTHYFRPEGRPREQQPWLCVVARRR